jgi:hypothetical protein
MGIGIAKGDPNKIVSFALKRKKKMTELKQIRVLVIDEVSMLSEKVVQIIENIADNKEIAARVRQDTGRYDRRFLPTAAHRDAGRTRHRKVLL